MDVDLIAGVLRQHRTVDASRRVPGKPGGYERRFECRCGWESPGYASGNVATEEAAETAALLHEAEQIAEALQLGTPEARGAGHATTSHATAGAVPAAGEES